MKERLGMERVAQTVFVVDDDPSVQKALDRLFRSAGLRVAVCASADAFLGLKAPSGPSCLVLDVSMPGRTGLELQQALADAGVRLPIVFLTEHGDIPMSVQAMKAGADDFLTKPFDNQQLLGAVRRALERSTRAWAEDAEVRALRQRVEALTPRERDVFELVVQGLTNRQAGYRIGVKEKTVKVHRGNVMVKMQARSLADLVRLAGRLGIGQPASSPCLDQGP
jgi:FixJ family two-component response regulator